AIHPVGSLLAGLACPAAHVIASFFRARAECIPRLATRTRRVEHSYHRAQTQSCEEPTEAIPITIRHVRYLLNINADNRMVALDWGKYNYSKTRKLPSIKLDRLDSHSKRLAFSEAERNSYFCVGGFAGVGAG